MGNLSLSCFFGRNIMKSSNIGGQAVMEGIMMRHKSRRLQMCIRKCKISQISTDPRCGKLRGFSGGRHKMSDVFSGDRRG